jgi:hypothetical protein
MGMACHGDWNFCTHFGVVTYACDLDILLHNQVMFAVLCNSILKNLSCNFVYIRYINHLSMKAEPRWWDQL